MEEEDSKNKRKGDAGRSGGGEVSVGEFKGTAVKGAASCLSTSQRSPRAAQRNRLSAHRWRNLWTTPSDLAYSHSNHLVAPPHSASYFFPPSFHFLLSFFLSFLFPYTCLSPHHFSYRFSFHWSFSSTASFFSLKKKGNANLAVFLPNCTEFSGVDPTLLRFPISIVSFLFTSFFFIIQFLPTSVNWSYFSIGSKRLYSFISSLTFSVVFPKYQYSSLQVFGLPLTFRFHQNALQSEFYWAWPELKQLFQSLCIFCSYYDLI